MRFPIRGGELSYRSASVQNSGGTIAELTYGHAATLWRINLGERRRANPNQLGFLLDMERGVWEKSSVLDENTEDEGMSTNIERVIPFVEDRRNCLLFEPVQGLSEGAMASLQAALKNAIQVRYDLEDNEIAAEPLPGPDKRKVILLYESSEGGAGVLRHLVDDREALSEISRTGLELCHFDPKTGNDLRRPPGAVEDCEAACYDCLMSYSNQRDHRLLDRQSIKEYLLELAKSQVMLSPGPEKRAEHLTRLKRLCQSELEKKWLDHLESHQLRLPSHAQQLVEACSTRPDFYYQEHQTAIYVDGPPHDYPERQERDAEQEDCMENHGYTVIRFRYDESWDETIEKYPSVFGSGT